ncbi:MAG: pyrroloquinoline quinone-dependent dehydrogenase [Robiginitomaculum sp.]|nr:MAG: pyrroloquinoline quinone-dependent dehydrogenase [Robiginitomaculum sp.]
MHMTKWFAALCLAVLANTLAHAEDAKTQWPLFGGDTGGSQYSPLSQINTENVKKLKVAWVHKSGDLLINNKQKWKSTGYEVSPIHANNSIYYCTPLNRVFSLDPATGEEQWVFDPHAPDPVTKKPLIDKEKSAAYCRGVAYWESKTPIPDTPCQKRVFRGDNHGHIYALDADTGLACRDFGTDKNHPGYVSNWDYPVHGEDPYRGTASPPTVIGDIMIAGSGAVDSIANSNDGVVRGWHAITGKLLWEFNPIPEGKRELTGAGNVWGPMTVDEKNGLVFLPTTSPSPDYYGGTRKFAMPLTSAIVALNAKTGDVVWSFQTVRHDVFDYDHGAHPLLVTIKKDGQLRDVAILHTKMGWVFVFDRKTGEHLWPIGEMVVPKSTVPGDVAAPTQPIPLGIDPIAKQSISKYDMWGITPLDKLWCERKYETLRNEGIYTPPSQEGSIASPSPFGGSNWGGASFDPTTNQLIVKAQNLPMILKITRADEIDPNGPPIFSSRPLVGTEYYFEGEVFMSPLGIPCSAPPWGTLTALNMDTGKINWQVPLGQSRRLGINVPNFFGWGAPNVGGPISTAGGLTFIAATMDGKFRAFDTKTGKVLWQDKLPAAGPSVPMSYEVGGRQFVVTTAGGVARLYNRLDDSLVAYALPQ